MGDFQIQLQPGLVTTFFFIVFDIGMLSIVDVALSRVVCRLYYARIRKGNPIIVSSSNIPGLVSCLVGRYYDPINVVAILVKLVFIGVVFLVNMDTSSTFFTTTTSSSFRFDASDAALDLDASVYRAVERRKSLASRCRQTNGDAIVYYRQAFHLRDGETLADEVLNYSASSRLYTIDDDTLTCLSPDFVQLPSPLVTIRGCSLLGVASCMSSSPLARAAVEHPFQKLIPDEDEVWVQVMAFRAGTYGIVVRHLSVDDELARIFGDYDDFRLWCGRIDAGYEAARSIFMPCVLIAKLASGTLLEVWEYKTGDGDGAAGAYHRWHPGPIFEDDVGDIGSYAVYSLLRYGWLLPKLNWEELSSHVVSEGLVYEATNITFTLINSTNVVTVVPWYVLGLALSCLGFSVIVCFVVLRVTRSDHRPRFNTVDGLSSILREEHRPTGISYEVGRTAVLGLFDTAEENRVVGPTEEAVIPACLHRTPNYVNKLRNLTSTRAQKAAHDIELEGNFRYS